VAAWVLVPDGREREQHADVIAHPALGRTGRSSLPSSTRTCLSAAAFLSAFEGSAGSTQSRALCLRIPAMTDPCTSCQDTGWVCERHPRHTWATSDEEEKREGYCPCGAPGMPCCECELFPANRGGAWMFTQNPGQQ